MCRSNVDRGRKLRGHHASSRRRRPPTSCGGPPMPRFPAPTTDDDWSRLLGPAAEATDEGLAVLDAAGTVRAANRAARRIAGDPGFQPLHADGTAMAAADRPGARAIATGEPVRDVSLVFRRHDGSRRWLRANAVPLFAGDDQHPYGAVVSFTDVTAFVAAQETLAERERDLALLATHSGDLIARHGEDGRIIHAAGDVEALLGFTADHLVGSWIGDVCHPADAPALSRARDDARHGRRGVVSYRITNVKDGREMWLESTVSPVLDEHGTFVEGVTTTRDITQRHHLEVGRREAEARFRAAFEHAPIGVCVLGFGGADPGQWVTVNPALAALLGHDREALQAKRISQVLHPDEMPDVRRRLRALVTGAAERVSVECRMLHAAGHVVWTLVTVAAVAGEDGRPAYGIAQIVDITERKRFEGQLQYLADHDALTGLFNRRRFEEELDRVLAGAERYGRAGAVLVLDLDGFKYVNDTLGHPVGDELIARLGATLRAELRESDVIARLGGDEFGVILPEADAQQATAVAAKLLAAVQRDGHVADSTRRANVTASIGLAPFDGADGLSAEELLVEADIAMYDAKEGGRNRAARSERAGAGPGRHVSRLSWLERIRTALAEDRFELHAQPIVAIGDDDEPPAFELLLRMRSDGDELVPPATFLPIAERFDLIQAIDRWVVGRAVALLRREHAAGRPVTLSVNLSGRTMGDADFAGWLEALLLDTPVPAGRLIVEITETAAIVNIERARALAATLRRLGCRLALDDFGAGFASFSSLKHLAFDLLKIDGEFVRGLCDNPTDRLVVEAVVAIARGLGTPSLAEFVADSDTLDAVRELGVDYAQGFHLGRPEPVDEALRIAHMGAGRRA